MQQGHSTVITAESARTTPENHLQVLDGLRGIAIILVVLLHTWEISWLNLTPILKSPIDLQPISATGFFGVDLFFFISAFCLTLPYARAHRAGAKPPTLGHFIVRRAAKILPSYWLAMAILLIFFPNTERPPEPLWFHIMTHLFFIHSWFQDTIGSINGVFWSMAVEVQFYAIFPLLMAFARRSLFVTLCVLITIAHCWHMIIMFWYHQHPDGNILNWHDLQLPSFLDVFAAGIAAAFVYVRWHDNPKILKLRPLFTVIALGALLAFFLEMNACFQIRLLHLPLRVWQVQNRWLIALTFFVLVVSSAFAIKQFRVALGNRFLLFLSAISYNLYIWHQWIAHFFFEHHIPPARLTDPHDDVPWQITFTAIAWSAALVLAVLLTYFFERPILNWSRRFTPSRKAPTVPSPVTEERVLKAPLAFLRKAIAPRAR